MLLASPAPQCSDRTRPPVGRTLAVKTGHHGNRGAGVTKNDARENCRHLPSSFLRQARGKRRPACMQAALRSALAEAGRGLSTAAVVWAGSRCPPCAPALSCPASCPPCSCRCPDSPSCICGGAASWSGPAPAASGAFLAVVFRAGACLGWGLALVWVAGRRAAAVPARPAGVLEPAAQPVPPAAVEDGPLADEARVILAQVRRRRHG